MPTIISPEILAKLEHNIYEIRCRALENVQSKFHSCNTDLDDLSVNVHILVSCLFNWFKLTPITHQRHVFDVLLCLLKSKYFPQTIQQLNKYYKRGELLEIGKLAEDEVSRQYFYEILDIIKNNRNDIDDGQTHRDEQPQIPTNNINLFDDDDDDQAELYSGLQFENAWEIPGTKDKQLLLTLRTSLSIECDEYEIDHAIGYFRQYVNDFPGEYFLQSPFIFMNLLQLLQSDDRKIDKTNVLTSILYLTRNLSRRVSIHRISYMYCWRKAVAQQQVTIGSYCSVIFRGVLDHLRQHYTTFHLIDVNECFSILMELIELICKSAVAYTTGTSIEYSIDHIIAELTDFLRFLRETTMNYRRSSNRIDRNTSISILYLLCRLIMFKENGEPSAYKDETNDSHYQTPSTRIAPKQLSQRMKDLSIVNKDNFKLSPSLRDIFQSTINDGSSISPSINEKFETAIGDMDSCMDAFKQELETALFDYSLTHFYPDVHQMIATTLKVESLADDNITNALLNLEESFKPIITLLKDPHMCTNEIWLKNGLRSIDILPLMKSDELTIHLFKAITSLTPKYNNDAHLLKTAEKLLISMLTTDCLDTKRLTYKMFSDRITNIYSRYMDGSIIIPKAYGDHSNCSTIFGLPLTTNILMEIICNGLTSDSSEVTKYTENILSLILESARFLKENWNKLFELLVPVLPLLSCFSNSSTTVGQRIKSLIDPDNIQHLSLVQLLKNNIVLLFSRDSNIRAEAITRLLYLIQSIPNADQYLPNIHYLHDVVPDSLCIIKAMNLRSMHDMDDLYDCSLAKKLLNILTNPYTDPATRHRTLAQLNLMLEDSSVIKHFNQNDGVRMIYDIWDKSLRKESMNVYANDAIQITSILSKMCLHLPTVRRRLSEDIQTYALILRSLLLNQHDDDTKRDCSVLLFILSFSDHIIGGTDIDNQFTIPIVCKKLLPPITCQFNMQIVKNQHGLHGIVSLMNKSIRNPVNLESDIFSICNERPFLQITDIWRYARMTFSSLWFGSLDNVLNSVRFSAIDQTYHINYKTNEHSFNFNKLLRMEKSDLDVIEATSPQIGINYWQKQIQNATSMNQVVQSCAAIENFSSIDSTTVKRQWNVEQFLHGIKRFCTIAPRNKQDEFLFSQICRLLTHLTQQEYVNIHAWLLNQFQEDCLYIDLITNSNVSTEVYICNILFIESICAKTIQFKPKKLIEQILLKSPKKKSSKSINERNNNKKQRDHLFDKLLDMAVGQLDELLNLKKSEELFQMVSLIKTLTSSEQITANDYDCSYIANKLMKLILAIKSFTQIGSNFNKNCLLAIGNLMVNVDELMLDQKHIGLLSSLCGHVDFEIRAYSWSILLKITTTLRGAELVVKEFGGLPGGFYACCMSTLLDEYETAMVRENAAFVFSSLISHRSSNGHLDEKVLPKLAGIDSNWLDILLNHHKFFDRVVDAIRYLYIKEFIERDKAKCEEKLVPSNLMRSYCVTLSHLLPVRLANGKEKVITAMLQIYKIIPEITQSINKSSVLLLIDLCDLISQCISYNKTLIDQISSEYQIVQALITFLNIKSFESIPNSIKHNCWSRILKVLRCLVYSSIGFQMICDSFTQNPEYLNEAFLLFIYGLTCQDLDVATMKFISMLLIMSQTKNKFDNFAEQLGALKIGINSKSTIKSFFYRSNVESQTLGDWLEIPDEEESEIEATCVLYEQLTHSFEKHSINSVARPLQNDAGQKHLKFDHLCKMLQALFKCSEHFRLLATADGFILMIIQQMERIYDCIDGSFTEFIRRNGNGKAEKFFNQLKQLLNIILSWYSSDCLQDVDCIQALLGICQKFWATIGANAELQMVMLNMLLFISEDSLPVCKQLASNLGGAHSMAFLQSIIEYAVSETNKPKTNESNFNGLEIALKIASNCCCCIEGRMLINKLSMLDTMNRLHPHVTRGQRPWPQITLLWLKFFEMFTRHDDSSKAIHLNSLINLAGSSSSRSRRLALEILRNMAFNTDNRSIFLNSQPFLALIMSTLDKNDPIEQFLITVSVWKLIAKNFKAKNTIKNSPIFGKLRSLRDSINRLSSKHKMHFDDENNSTDETIEDLSVALDCVLGILQMK